MKTATVNQIKKELIHLPNKDLIELCLKLSKFKKENKEFLTYLLFETDEEYFVTTIKEDVKLLFKQINTNSYFYIKKSVRKILRLIKKYIRYSKNKETEIELLLFFCDELTRIEKPFSKNVSLQNIYNRQIVLINKAILTLHEDLQYDYKLELSALNT